MKEQLSAMMDDQGDHAECERCLDRLKEDKKKLAQGSEGLGEVVDPPA